MDPVESRSSHSRQFISHPKVIEIKHGASPAVGVGRRYRIDPTDDRILSNT